MWKCFLVLNRTEVDLNMSQIRFLQCSYPRILSECRKKYFVTCSRYLCADVKSTEKSDNKKKYSNTVLLPNTSLQLRIEPGEKAGHDHQVAKTAEFESLYNWQRDALQGEEFILHDGPPYANGNPHIGHAVNKILKDIITRNKMLDGHKIHYTAGWDCHGLPIELKAITNQDKGKPSNLSPTEIRQKARNFAQDSILAQMRAFKVWGLMADWKKCYFTYDTSYIENQLQQFFRLYEKNFIYRSFLPIYWSPSSKTALAEAELEYNQQHKSTCVVLRLKVQSSPIETSNGPVYALIWTTTPWTLPANKAIGFNPEIEYSLVKIDQWDGVYMVASPLIQQFEELLETKITVETSFPGAALEKSVYQHPIKRETLQPFLAADFVSSDKGTGLVHIAPTHGHDDFALGRKHNLPMDVLVDKDGKYVSEAGAGLEGLDILGLGGRAVRLLLEDDILHTHKLVHSYPYDWRTKEPVIICASKQWFMNLDSVKPLASAFAADIPVLPENLGGKENLLAKINSRSYWCISRQRVWGVPIPIFFTKDTDSPILSKSLIDHYCSLLKQHGPDFWWSLNNADLLPEKLAEENGVKAEDIGQLQRSTDILDIWLDSGLSWSAVLGGRQADLYLEGVDQCTGWFQSSLLTSVALENRPPYKSLFVHGFVVDNKGNKMSKSVGNVVDPREVIYGGQNKKKLPPFGVDVLRWWVAGHTVQHSNIPIGLPILKDSEKEVQRLRSILRHILGNLDGVKKIPDFPKQAKDISNCLIDRYLLHELYNFNQQITEYYKSYQFNFVRIAVNNLLSNQLSAEYFNTVKNRMYCDELTSPKRVASQVIFYAALEVLLRAVGPIVPHLTEEVCQHHVCLKETSFFRRRALAPLNLPDAWNDPTVLSEMKVVNDVKHAVNKVKGTENTWNLHATVRCKKDDFKVLKALNDEDRDQLLEMLQLRSLEILPSENELLNVAVDVVDIPLCLRCRRNSIVPESDICQSCSDVLGTENKQARQHAP